MQQLLQLEQTNYSGNGSGFRLQRYEVLNWGTFDKRPWTLDLQGKTTLLTGANGSGKSTLVDGLLTLLVPNRGRNYNLASGDTGKRERDEKSYVQGAYDRTSSEESYGSKSKLLREQGEPTVLLLYFLDAESKQKVTLAQVLWIQERKVKKFFVIAKDELSIVKDFNNFENTLELKKRLKKQKAEVFDNFSKYSASFCKLLGLQSDKALDLFNQTVSIKEIKSLNNFVRQHMLEQNDVRTKIEELQKSYEDLTVCYNAIEQARQQLEVLIPLAKEAENYHTLTKEVAALEENLAVAPAYFAKRKFELLAGEIARIEQQLIKKKQEKNDCDRQLEDLRQQETNLKIAISKDDIGQRLAELEREIKQLDKELSSKKKKAIEYDRLADLLQLPSYQDSSIFDAAREEGNKLQLEIDNVLEKLETQRDELLRQRNDLNKQQQELQTELNSLRQRKSQIPQRNLDIRDRIINQLNLNKADLPFVGELLKVKDSAFEWEGAIERLLKSFGLCVLVSDRDYQQVNSYVNNNSLKGRLVYYRITPLAPQPTQRAVDPNKLLSKLEIKPDNKTFSQWLQYKLVQSYNYTCCDTEEQFKQQTRAITKTGLIKHGGERHEKDDSYRINDRRNYILGWDNAEKIAAIEVELSSVNQKLNELNKQIKSIEKKRSQRNQQQLWLQNFMNFNDFIEIDWHSVEQKKQKIEQDLIQLEASSDRLKQLEFQLKEVKEQIKVTNLQRDSLIGEIKTLENNRDRAKKEQLECEQRIVAVKLKQIKEFADRNLNRLRRYKLDTETIDKDKETIIEKLNQEIRSKRNKQNECKQSILGQLLQFRNKFPEATIDIGTAFESLPEYIKLKNRIEQDDLPRHEKRFKDMMTGKITQFVTLFQSNLMEQETDIKQSIDNLNKSLRQIDYTDSTYIELQYRKNSDRQIANFRNSLRTCLGDAARNTAEDNEERFKNIQKLLIEPFKAETRWTNKVTDVRNWLDFSVSERDRSNDSEKSYYTDSSGLSGGQKRKLACTILASAIAYSFGLHRTNFSGKSFRFVVIDEAFSKLDDDNARYAMELFKTLNLQLLMITPKDKINITEPYISSLHFIHNTEQKNFSSVTSLSIEEYQQNRQSASIEKRDKSLSD